MIRGNKGITLAKILWLAVFFVFQINGGHLAAQTDKTPAAADQRAAGNGEGRLSLQEYANLIAGRPLEPDILGRYVNVAGWRQYAQEIDEIWARFEKKSLNPMRAWAAQELGDSQASTQTVFYPFSGPDLVNPLAFFPQARTYILIALEPVGALPIFKPGENDPFYHSLEDALRELLQFNFFFTKRMENNLVKKELSGVLPVLLFFLGREQVQLLEISYWMLQADGSISTQPASGGAKMTGPGIPGVKIVFQRQSETPARTLYYFQFNLANYSWRRQPHFSQFLKDFAPFQTFVKAASYLMYKPHFGDIRQFILENSQLVLQTDEGIPVKFFDPGKWERRFYGKYSCPIKLFSNCFQADLAAIYQEGQNIQPLPYGIGYHHRRNSSNLMLAIRKVDVARQATP